MLKLARRQGESIVLRSHSTGETIRVVVLHSSSRIELGIAADSDWKILRDELIGRSRDVEAFDVRRDQ